MKPYLARAERTRQSGPHGQAVCPTPPLYGAASAGGERQAPPPGVNSGAHPHIRKFTCKQKGQRVWHKKNPKLIELARPYKFDDKEYTEIDLSGLDDLTIKDAVLIIKKLYNEGEMAVMITPETATAYTDALAAAATKLPIEFFQLLPIGASKKVRQTVQASLRSAAAEEDGDEDEHSHIMKFGKPYTYKGEKYTEVDLSGVANLTGMNVRQAENRMEEEDIRAAEKTLNYYYCCLIASMATGKDVAFFLGLPLAEAVQLRAGVNHKDFFA